MAFDNYTREFVGIPETATPRGISMLIDSDECRPIVIPCGDYTFNREGRFVPIDSPDAVSYVVPAGMRVKMSEVDPEDDDCADDDELDDDEDDFDDDDDADDCEDLDEDEDDLDDEDDDLEGDDLDDDDLADLDDEEIDDEGFIPRVDIE